ncbi:FG-GAP repeat protein [Streptomyces cellostaticus]|uniref:FG-GAP repeat protein n=1 Tax=Streptomyces cellostaticus TaxID=67285 RepID=UPI00131BC754|nr:FG-GAP repeat protein [Streptomyces cellostaticus]
MCGIDAAGLRSGESLARGRIARIPGAPDGPDGVKAAFLDQDSPGVPGTAERGDVFGTDVRVADVDGDGCPDVLAGRRARTWAPGAARARSSSCTAGASGRTGTGARVIGQDTPGVPGTAEKGDPFGALVLCTPAANGRIGSGFSY